MSYSPQPRVEDLVSRCVSVRLPLLEAELSKLEIDVGILKERDQRRKLQDRVRRASGSVAAPTKRHRTPTPTPRPTSTLRNSIPISSSSDEDQDDVDGYNGDDQPRPVIAIAPIKLKLNPGDDTFAAPDYSVDNDERVGLSYAPPELPAKISPLVVEGKSMTQLMLDILDKFREHDPTQVFHDLVDLAEVPDYYEVIPRPMSFSCMEKKVLMGEYSGFPSFRKDMELIFNNCFTYNPKGGVYFKLGKAVSSNCNRVLKQAESKFSLHEHQPFINPFHEISECEFPIEPEITRLKLQTTLSGECSEGCGCVEVNNLGPYDLNTTQFESSCCDRQHALECSDACSCGPACQNRSIRDNSIASVVETSMVYGIDQYTFREIMSRLPIVLTDAERVSFVEKQLLPALNHYVPGMDMGVRQKVHMKYSLENLIENSSDDATLTCSRILIRAIEASELECFVYSKGHGAILASKNSIRKNEVVAEYFGEVYPAWRFYEKQSAIRQLTRSGGALSNLTLGFYNIMLERGMTDPQGYDLAYVDACRRGNFASRCSHSCDPNSTCVAIVTDNRYTISVIALREVSPGEEITFNYHSVTDSKEEHNDSICFCGQSKCRGRYIDYAGVDNFQQIIETQHRFAERALLLVDACRNPVLSLGDMDILDRCGFRSLQLHGVPNWVQKYLAKVLEFVVEERKLLPFEILKNKEYTYTEADAVTEASGVYHGRIQNLSIVLDQVRYFLRQQPNRLEAPVMNFLSDHQVVTMLWNADDSVVAKLTTAVVPHIDREESVMELILLTSTKIPLDHHSVTTLKKRLRDIRSFLLELVPTAGAFHKLAADLLTFYINTDCWFTHAPYESITSPNLELDELGLDMKKSMKLPAPRSYGPSFLWSALSYWMNPSLDNPEQTLSFDRRFFLQLPSISACYSAGRRLALKQGAYRAINRQLLFETLSLDFSNVASDTYFVFGDTSVVFGSPILDYYLINKDLGPILDEFTSLH